MKINTITVHAGRTFSHPYESYSNLKPSLSLTATLDVGDDETEAIKSLQQQAETAVEAHKQQLLADLHQLQRRSRVAASIESTEQQIKRLQEELQSLKTVISTQASFPMMEQCGRCKHFRGDHDSDGDLICTDSDCDCEGYEEDL